MSYLISKKCSIVAGVVAVAAVGCSMTPGSVANATAIPANAYYGDTFTTNNSSRIIGGFSSLLGGQPEINTTGNGASYGGYGQNLFTFVNGTNNAVNGGASTGATTVSDGGNDASVTLPIPAQQFTASLDVIPFQGVQGGSQDDQNIGLFLTNNLNNSFFNGGSGTNSPTGQMRVGITHDLGTAGNPFAVFVEAYGGPANLYDLTTNQDGFNPDNWNNIQAQFNLTNNTVSVYLNSSLVTSLSLSGGTLLNPISNATGIGIDAIDSSNTRAYMDNFFVAPTVVPEPSVLGLMGVCGLALLFRKRLTRI